MSKVLLQKVIEEILIKDSYFCVLKGKTKKSLEPMSKIFLKKVIKEILPDFDKLQ